MTKLSGTPGGQFDELCALRRVQLALSETQIVASDEWMRDRDLEGSCR